jgi:hypothetical protein
VQQSLQQQLNQLFVDNMIAPLEIKNQENSDFCVGCVISAIAEQFLGETCDESYSFAMGKRFSKEPLSKRGLNPKDALMGAIEYGVLPKNKSPYSIATHSRDFLADWKNWQEFEKFAIKPFGSFKKVKNIDDALLSTTVLTGLFWQGEWNSGIMITDINNSHKYEPHEVRIIGKKDEHYVVQNSRGSDVGENGLWYMDKTGLKYIHHMYTLHPEPWKNLLEKLLTKLV